MQENDEESEIGENKYNRVKRVVLRPLEWVWQQIKIPVLFIALSWCMGFGFYHGVMGAVDFGKMSIGKAIVIAAIDLPPQEANKH